MFPKEVELVLEWTGLPGEGVEVTGPTDWIYRDVWENVFIV